MGLGVATQRDISPSIRGSGPSLATVAYRKEFSPWGCVCARVCVCVCVRKHQVAVMMVQRVRQDVGTPEVKKMGEKRKIMREMKWNLKKHAEKHHTKEDCGRS